MLRTSLALLLVALLLSPAEAQRKGKPPAFTSEAEAGLDYAIQGEYGGLLSGGYRRQRVGVQIIALGDGQFEAVEYAGGLPGDGWTGEPPLRAPGQRQGALAVIDGPDRVATVLRSAIWVRDRSTGALLGMLHKARRRSSTLGARPPSNAIVLFDGASAEEFQNGRVSEEGWLMEGAETKRLVGDFFLHLEFRTPFMPTARGQARGNSGVYLQRRYETQILDSFGLEGLHNECGGLYRQKPPRMNVCLPPLSWQTYDIDFRAARFDEQGKKAQNARITVRHNGVVIHDDYELTNKTGAGRPEAPEPGPILLQNHGNPVRFRNIWLIDRGGASERLALRVW